MNNSRYYYGSTGSLCSPNFQSLSLFFAKKIPIDAKYDIENYLEFIRKNTDYKMAANRKSWQPKVYSAIHIFISSFS